MIKENLVDLFINDPSYKPLGEKELATVLNVGKEETQEFVLILDQLCKKGRIIRTKKGKISSTKNKGMIAGVFRASEKGFGFVVADQSFEHPDDFFVAAPNTGGAMHLDRVLIKINTGRGKNTEGEVIKVLERANEKVVGTYEKTKNFGFVVPDDKKLNKDIFIPKQSGMFAKTGQKVVVKVTKWPEQDKNPEGEIEEILGFAGEQGIDVMSVIRQYSIAEEFDVNVIKEAERVAASAHRVEQKKREDLRGEKILTIDGEDAKDLDDAVSIERHKIGYRLGVHIADVSEFVKEDSLLDKEAYERGTSVYFTDRVIPMLPRILSNGVCSLNAGEDKFALSVFMLIDNKGKVVDYEIKKTLIKSGLRATYKEVTAALEGEDAATEKYKDFMEEIVLMKELALLLQKNREKRGSINFNFPEAKIIVDESGKPIDVKRYEVSISNHIIEEFMLVCNETIAEHMFWAQVPSIYRVHEDPDPDKVAAFIKLVEALGYSLKSGQNNAIKPITFSGLLKKIQGKPEEMAVSTILLRSMMKARYSHENLGHFGLAAKYYLHFTSPIRRYPDLVVHRILKELLSKGISDKRREELISFTKAASKQSSECEINAVMAEREIEDIKKAEFMKGKVGESFDGVICSVTSFGMFVELENTIEGLVRMKDLTDDYYVFEKDKYRLTGERTGQVYKLGDKIQVKLVSVDVKSGQIDFILD